MSDPGANFDKDHWYHIQTQGNRDQYVIGTYLYADNGTVGGVFNNNIDGGKPEEQRWQFFPVGDSFVLRTVASGHTGYLRAVYSVNETYNNGRTVVAMANETLLDPGEVAGGDGNASIFWNVGFWDDGSQYLWNRDNGSDWRLLMKPNAFTVLDRNLTGPPDGMRFNLSRADPISDQRYSSILLPSAGGVTTATLSGAPTGAATGGTDSGSGGLSTGAQAGIGVGVGIVGLVAIILGVWFLLRRRQQTRRVHDAPIAQSEQYHTVDKKYFPDGPPDSYAELGGGQGSFPAEMFAEGGMHKVNNTPAELPSEPAVTNRPPNS
ncbi:hypothetical protein EJ05DRAFT_506785 [Pseudovirgaria hyperparasitica]|uniref:Ricin B lectin domain-containing protein n=1 Tax=Pseudovirgaria hyperparasitica TaxID=470096 RepID=A0A6A6WLT9_9PEZI|nr:uncharacterized protein EJ05DRAFT_506785 [Pseudovirgaria hyperparasitica]KAF2763165.1 hypothetical protein EJ05DRAFT_506785 [Pseudovirgaria hyperparasitica]